MNSNEDTKDLEVIADDGADDSVTVDDFIRELEAKEKDLHITSETTIIEIAQAFDDVNPPVFLNIEPQSSKAIEPAETIEIPPVSSPADCDEVVALQCEVAELRDKLAAMEDERADILMGAQRRSKDFDSYRARTERERTDMMESQICDLAGRLLPALDNLHRAIAFAGGLPEEKSEEFRHFFSGMVLVEKQVGEILSDLGIEAIPTVGESFDPHLHEAVATEPSSEHPENTVTQELLRGYRVGERVIRHSMVKVAAASANPNEPRLSPDDEPFETDPLSQEI